MTTRRLTLAISVLVLVAACDRIAFWRADLFSAQLEVADGSMMDLESLKQNTASVFVFVAPDCPLSQNYTLTLNELAKQFESKSVQFYGVIAGDWFDKSEIDEFITTYNTQFPILLDRDFRLAKLFDATITPEAFTVDGDGNILYQGAIDNWAGELGQHRTVITEHYLRDALTRIVLGKSVQITATQAVGCYIERLG